MGERTAIDHYCIGNKDTGIRFARIIRRHWSLDVTFKEAGYRVCKDYSPQNLNNLRKIALSRLRVTDGTSESVPSVRLCAQC